MENIKKAIRFTRVKRKPGSLLRKNDSAKEKIKPPATDQSTGPQQLYEGKKVRSSSQDKTTITEQEKTDRTNQHTREQKESSE
jgi:hypothetical protein